MKWTYARAKHGETLVIFFAKAFLFVSLYGYRYWCRCRYSCIVVVISDVSACDTVARSFFLCLLVRCRPPCRCICCVYALVLVERRMSAIRLDKIERSVCTVYTYFPSNGYESRRNGFFFLQACSQHHSQRASHMHVMPLPSPFVRIQCPSCYILCTLLETPI